MFNLERNQAEIVTIESKTSKCWVVLLEELEFIPYNGNAGVRGRPDALTAGSYKIFCR
jgi:hypothetical protein